MTAIFDTHAHYDAEQFDEKRDEIITRLFDSGNVGGIVNCACDKKSVEATLKLAEKYLYIYAAVGFHPENLSDGVDIDFLKNAAKHEKTVAIGEIGLDYYWDSEHKNEMKNAFEKQILLANELSLPVIVHDREAHADTLEILKKHKPAGILHCFSGSVETAREILKLGMYIGIGGSLTFKNAKRLIEVAYEIPLEKIVLETDCPYMAPEPYRGKLNDSSLIIFVAKKLAEIKGISVEEVLKTTFDNAVKIFGIKTFKQGDKYVK